MRFFGSCQVYKFGSKSIEKNENKIYSSSILEDDVYESPNWGETEGELVMDIEASIGFVEFIFED